MKRNLFLGVACLWALSVVAQQDPVLMRINGKDVTRSEFEYIYNKNNSLNGLEQKTLDEYVSLFVNFKLKVTAAEAAGMDTAQAFQDELAGYRRQVAKTYLTDEEAAEAYAHEVYTKMKANSRAGQVQVAHIFKYLPQTISTTHLRKEQARMDSIYTALKSDPQVDFMTYVGKFSDDNRTFWVGWLQTPQEFEDVAFSLPKGDVSKPFFTPQGLHIVKVMDRKEIGEFEEMKEDIIRRQTHKYGMDKGTEALVQKLKGEYQYIPNNVGIEELLQQGETQKILFTLEGKIYTGVDLQRFAKSNPLVLKEQLELFIAKTVLDYENSRLEQKYPAFRLLMQEYKEGMLLFEISNREIWERAVTDESGLAAYFKLHKSNYNWKLPQYNGMVLHCANKKIAKQAKKLIKKLPVSEWKDAILKEFNTSSQEVVKVEQGLYAIGDNKYVDKLIFKQGEFEPVESYPFTVVIGDKQKGPNNYKEVRGPLAADYQNYLDSCWIERLRGAAKVEINQEVLKTVNKH